MWKKRLWETFAIITIGDGAIEVLAPRGHSLLWQVGPGRKIARFFADNPNYMRLLGASQIAFGIWLALRQYRDGQRRMEVKSGVWKSCARTLRKAADHGPRPHAARPLARP